LVAPELPTLPALPVVPAPLLVAPALPALPDAAPAEPPSEVVLLEQPSADRHAPQVRRRNHLEHLEVPCRRRPTPNDEIATAALLGAISLPESKFEFEHGIGV
jgi:hypothetical protein